MEGGASSVRPRLGCFNHYDTLNTGGAGKHRGREAVNEFGREQLLNKNGALFIPRRDAEVGPPGAQGGLPEGVKRTEAAGYEGLSNPPHKSRLNDDHEGLR